MRFTFKIGKRNQTEGILVMNTKNLSVFSSAALLQCILIGFTGLRCSKPGYSVMSIQLEGKYTLSGWGVADLDGDSQFDFLVKWPKDQTVPGRPWERSKE